MNEEIKKHIADLVVKLETRISIEMSYRFSPANKEYSWSAGEYTESCIVGCDSHKVTKRPLLLINYLN